MEISPITTDAGMLSMVRQMETSTAVQTSVLKTMADSQQEMAEMLHDIGVGQKVDIRT
ncbi:MAG: hypothetical protein KFF50_10705 [Desulfatitalea sp.]|jgi:hypothetical protein|nr:hypothetical protein [Desulfatitalea sp.]